MSLHSDCFRVCFRCIKPNNDKVPKRMEKEKVVAQLKYSGILEVCKIRRSGFSYRPTFEEFIEKYKILLFGATAHLEATAEIAREILEKSFVSGYKIGKSKVKFPCWTFSVELLLNDQLKRRSVIVHFSSRKKFSSCKNFASCLVKTC